MSDIDEIVATARNHAFAVANGLLLHQAAVTLYRGADTIEALRAELERLRGEQRLKSLIGPSENAVERIITERDSLREVIDHLNFNWIDCPHCDRNKELVESFIKEEKKEI